MVGYEATKGMKQDCIPQSCSIKHVTGKWNTCIRCSKKLRQFQRHSDSMNNDCMVHAIKKIITVCATYMDDNKADRLHRAELKILLGRRRDAYILVLQYSVACDANTGIAGNNAF